MYKYIITLLFITSISNAAEKDSLPPMNIFQQKLNGLHAFLAEEEDCDACGCSASGGSMGFNSIISPNFAGLRYFYQSYQTNDGLYSNSPWLDQNFNTVQVWGRIPITKNIQSSIQIPYHYNSRELEEGNQSIYGIGDVTVIGLYRLIQTKKDSLPFTHTLYAGGVVKIPLGTYDAANNGSVNPSFQLGTGSWDFMFLTEHTLRKNKWGINTMVNYIYKTENQKDYRFGNQFNYGSSLFYLHTVKKVSIVPQGGIAGEVYAANELRGLEVRNTAGDIFFGKIGIEIGKDKFSIGGHAFLPIAQNLTGGLVEANFRLNFYVNYNL
jgi:hypothetical protein